MDLVRATFSAGSNEQFEAAITELDTLAPAFPGLEPHALLAKVELPGYAGQLDAAHAEAERLLNSARETGNRWAVGKALTFLEQPAGGQLRSAVATLRTLGWLNGCRTGALPAEEPGAQRRSS